MAHDLLGCSIIGGMFGHVEVNCFSTIMAEDNEHIENTKCGCRNNEQIVSTELTRS